MQRYSLGRHLREHIVDLGAVGHACHQRRIFRAHFYPVRTMHIFVVEKITMHAPGIDEHLLPFFARVNLYRPVTQIDRKFCVFGQRRCRFADLKYIQLVGFSDEQFLAIRRHRVAADFVEKKLDHRRQRIRRFNGNRAQRKLLLYRRFCHHKIKALAVGGKLAVIAGRHRHFVQTLLQAVEFQRRNFYRFRFSGNFRIALFVYFAVRLRISFAIACGRGLGWLRLLFRFGFLQFIFRQERPTR